LIDVQRLAILREVARCGTFAGAAAALHHTPSAVSQQIAALERGTGLTLVERSTRGALLTDAGRILLASADAVHAELRLAEQRLLMMRTNGPQALTVVTFPSAGEPLLAPALAALAGSVPQDTIDITVIEAEPDQALQIIRGGEADIAIVYHFHTPDPPKRWRQAGGRANYTPLLSDPLRLVLPTKHRLARRRTLRMADLADERWIQAWGEPGTVLDTLAATAGIHPHIACRSSDYRFMTALVGAGVGIALIPRLALTDIRTVTDVDLNDKPSRYVGTYTPQRHWTNPAVDQLRTQLSARARTLSSPQRHLPRPTSRS
jgi:DNA-binding transcriptional LysR family regulator